MRAIYLLAGLGATTVGLAFVGLTKLAAMSAPCEPVRTLNFEHPVIHMAVGGVRGRLTVCGASPVGSQMPVFEATGVAADVDCLVCLDLAPVGGAR